MTSAICRSEADNPAVYAMPQRLFALLLTGLVSGTLAGCDLEALLADPKAVQREADAKAIGSACRHGLRPIEDCYALNPKASKALIFAGWKAMDEYMRENKIEGSAPTGVKPPPQQVPADEAVDEKPGDKAAKTNKPEPKADSKADSKGKSKAS